LIGVIHSDIDGGVDMAVKAEQMEKRGGEAL
jgi:hypothetical protein